jgi:predicted SnoaL-like aldol condensation-catalyzing enzyme
MRMNAENNKKVLAEFHEEVFRKRDLTVLDRFMQDDYVQHNPDEDQGKK